MPNKETNSKIVTLPNTQTKPAETTEKPAQPKPPKGADKKPNLHDQFGYGLETQNHKFGEMLLRDGGCTMREVREAAWNTKGISFYNAFNNLVKKSLAIKTDGRMRAVVPPKQGGK